MRKRARTLLVLGLVLSASVWVVACVGGPGGVNPVREWREVMGADRDRQGGQQTQRQRQSISAAPEASGQFTAFTLPHGGETRRYFVHQPAAGGAGALPVMLAFHGGGGDPQSFAARTGLVEMADRYGFLLVVPEGVRGSWNTGGASPVGFAARSGVDDTGFVGAMLDEVLARYPADRSRVFAAGLSAGGMMAYRLACEMPERLSAIAVVAGTMAVDRCIGATGVSLLHIHGSNDQNVPLQGGAGTMSAARANYPSVLNGIALFQERNQCTLGTSVTQPAQDTTCEIRTCGTREVVEFCTVSGGGHGWPGIDPARWQERNDVYVSPHFDATGHIARFFLAQ
ncbi:MAG: hypothetical protein JJT81_00065 [Rubellimicrobium sp.]|nr:hypothetical protein [Rubellimicrobium sp.]